MQLFISKLLKAVLNAGQSLVQKSQNIKPVKNKRKKLKKASKNATAMEAAKQIFAHSVDTDSSLSDDDQPEDLYQMQQELQRKKPADRGTKTAEAQNNR